MASVSSTSSLGNTSLRGYGGMASGIDRDAIIEKMTLGTTTKISNQKGKITQLQWKQEAYRNISDQILDLADKYTSYSSTNSLKDASIFSKSVVTVHGKEDSTRFVKATGSSDLVDNVSITGVKQLATSTVIQSNGHTSSTGLQTSLKSLDQDVVTSNLEGSRLILGTWSDKNGLQNRVTFTLPSTYTDENGKKQTIDYTSMGDMSKSAAEREAAAEKLVSQLNEALKSSDISLGDSGVDLKDAIRFTYNKDTGRIGIQDSGEAEDGTKLKGLGDFVIDSGSTVLKGMGYQALDNIPEDDKKAQETISVAEFNAGVARNTDSFEQTAVNHQTALSYLAGKKVTFNYDGNQKEIELITKDEAATLGAGDLDKVKENLQNRLNRAFGSGVVTVDIGADGLNFQTKSDSSLSITSGDSELLTSMGIAYGESNKVNLNGKLDQSALKGALGDATGKVNFSDYTVDGTEDGELNLVINDVEIKGLTKDSSISEILSKINSSDAGVKAAYVDATGQFMLVSSETGADRTISLGSELAEKLFDGTEVKGQNAKIQVSYGNGVSVDLERSSNTFNLEGLNVTVSGVFGGKWNEVADYTGGEDAQHKKVIEDGQEKWMEWKADSSEAVTFSAKADVDAATERVKSFFEDFNALVTDINKEVTTRPDSSYGPLTDEQKDEMDETSIKNWEAKAKEGILYGDAAMRDLSTDVQGVLTKLMSSGVNYADLEKIGISYAEDWGDGGTIVFNESKFRQAMETDPDMVSNIFTGGGGVSKGLIDIVDETFTPYATRYASKNAGDGGKGSYGRLIEIAGSEKKPTTLISNEIYNQIKDLNTLIEQLQDKLKKEQDRYISQFTTMETLISQMNNQSSYLSQLSG